MTDEGPEKREDEPNEQEVFERLKNLLGPEGAQLEKALDTPAEELTEEQKRMLELYEEIGAATETRQSEEQKREAEFAERLEKLEDRAAEVRKNREIEDARRFESHANDRADSRGLGIGLMIAYAIIGTPLLMAGIGYLIDVNQKTEFYKGMGALAGAVIGIVYAITVLNRENDRK